MEDVPALGYADLRIVFGAAPDPLTEALAERVSLEPAVQFERSANRVIWLYRSTQIKPRYLADAVGS